MTLSSISEDDPNRHLLESLAGTRLPGGCDHCNAYQDVGYVFPLMPSAYGVVVRHDDWCPWWKAERARDERRNRLAKARQRR